MEYATRLTRFLCMLGFGFGLGFGFVSTVVDHTASCDKKLDIIYNVVIYNSMCTTVGMTCLVLFLFINVLEKQEEESGVVVASVVDEKHGDVI
jgi:hypothetical protein